jgi:hypothetical protein
MNEDVAKTWNIGGHKRIYNLLRLIFRSTTVGFSKFFFLQRDKYLTPFVLFIFKCLETDSFDNKSRSLAMLTFLLEHTQLPKENMDLIQLTLPNILSHLNTTIDQKQ